MLDDMHERFERADWVRSGVRLRAHNDNLIAYYRSRAQCATYNASFQRCPTFHTAE